MLHSVSLKAMQWISLCGSNDTSYQMGAIQLLGDSKRNVTQLPMSSCRRKHKGLFTPPCSYSPPPVISMREGWQRGGGFKGQFLHFSTWVPSAWICMWEREMAWKINKNPCSIEGARTYLRPLAAADRDRSAVAGASTNLKKTSIKSYFLDETQLSTS